MSFRWGGVAFRALHVSLMEDDLQMCSGLGALRCQNTQGAEGLQQPVLARRGASVSDLGL